MLNGLDLFAGIGGITLALEPWVRPVAYCEKDRFAQAVLLSRMSEGRITTAPIWDDVTTLDGRQFRGHVDIIYGGFPCQDISIAGKRKGLEAERSGLFFEVMRLAEEIKPQFLFLENVPAIRAYLPIIAREMANLRYDCRWCLLSAEAVGAAHTRNRWFLVANSKGKRINRRLSHLSCTHEAAQKHEVKPKDASGLPNNAGEEPAVLANTNGKGLEIRKSWEPGEQPSPFGSSWWKSEPNVDRMANGVPHRVDRIKSLGNAVVPHQAREAFKMLMGL